MKRMLAVLLALTLVCGCLPALALADGSATERKIIYPISDDPEQMDPTLNSYSRSSIVLQQMFRGLYKTDVNGQIVPAMATGYTVSEDNLTYTFELREGLKWSDGSDLTAADFYYSWMRVIDPAVASRTVSAMFLIKNAEKYYNGEATKDEVGIKLIDELHIEVTLEYLAPWFISLTASTAYMPVKEAVVESETPWTKDPATYVCNGPFYPVEFKSKELIALKKNPYYADAEQVKLDAIDIVVIEAAETELAAYKNGEINVSDNISAEAMQLYQNTEEYFDVDRIGVQYCDFNNEKEPFTDKRVREALAYAMDRQLILTNILQTTQKPLFGVVPYAQPSITDPSKSYREVAGDLFTEDVELAKQLLAEAGYPNGEGFPTVQFVVQATQAQKDFAQALQAMWKSNLGINVEIVTYESKIYWDELAQGNFDICWNGYTCDYLDPVAHLEIYSDGGTCHENRWNNAQFDEMVDAIFAEPDPATREQMIIDCEKYMMDEMPVFPVYSYSDSYLVKPAIKDVTKNYVGHICFEYAYFAD